MPDAAAPGGHRLVVDNNSGARACWMLQWSPWLPCNCRAARATCCLCTPRAILCCCRAPPRAGTFAPPASLLPRMRDLLLANWPGMAVEMLAADDPRLEQYHRECPSRLKAAVAAEAVAEAEAAAAAAGPAAASPAGSGGVNGAPAAEEP